MSAIAAIHAGLRQLGIDEEDARDLYERQTGQRSLRAMKPQQLQAIVGELRRLGFKTTKKGLEGPFSGKLQALWIAGWNLGVVLDRADTALVAFVKRQAHVDHARFLLDGEEAAKVIDALKAWFAREAGVDWSVRQTMSATERMPGFKVATAQWRKLVAMGVEPRIDRFTAFVQERSFNPLAQMTSKEWEGIMNTLGSRIRAAQKARSAA